MNRVSWCAAVVTALVMSVTVAGPEPADAAVTGSFSTLAGGGAGDGDPAVEVTAGATTSAVAPDGAVLFVDRYRDRVRRIDPVTGLLSTVAGIGVSSGVGCGEIADGTPATEAGFCRIASMAVSPAGDLYVLDQQGQRLLRVAGSTHQVTRVAGNGTRGPASATADARTIPLDALAVAYDAADGVLYLSDRQYRFWQLDASLGLALVAGNGTNGYGGEGTLAVNAPGLFTQSIAAGPDGDLYLAGCTGVRRVDRATGIISTVLGRSTSTTTRLKAGDTPTAASLNSCGSVTATSDPDVPTGTLLLASDGTQVVRVPIAADGSEGVVHVTPWPRSGGMRLGPLRAGGSLLLAEGDRLWSLGIVSGAVLRLAGLDPSYAVVDDNPDGTPVADARFALLQQVIEVAGEPVVLDGDAVVHRIGADGLTHRLLGKAGPLTTDWPADGTGALDGRWYVRQIAPAADGGLLVLIEGAASSGAATTGRLYDLAGGVLTAVGGGGTQPYAAGQTALQLALPADAGLATLAGGDAVVSTANDLLLLHPDGSAGRVELAAGALPLPSWDSGHAPYRLAPAGGTKVLVERDGRLWRVDTADGSVTPLLAAPWLDGFAQGTDGAVYVVGRGQLPAERRLLRLASDGSLAVVAADGTALDAGPLATMALHGGYGSGRNQLAAAADGTLLVGSFSGRVLRTSGLGATGPVPPTLTGFAVAPGTGGALVATWDPSGLPVGAKVEVAMLDRRTQAPVLPLAQANGFLVTADAAAGTATLPVVAPGVGVAVTAWVLNGDLAAGAELSVPSWVNVLVPGDTTPPTGLLTLQVLASGTTAQLYLESANERTGQLAMDLSPGTAAPVLGAGIVPVILVDPYHAFVAGLVPGSTYTVAGRTIDEAGNVSPPRSLTFVADASPQVILSGPATGTWLRTTTTTFGLASDVPGTYFVCALDDVPQQCDPSPWTLTGLAPGRHTIVVTPSGPLGAGVAARRVFGVDLDTPTAAISAALPAFVASSSVSVPIVARDATSGIASWDLRYRSVSRYGAVSSWIYPTGWQRVTSTRTLSGAWPGTSYCFSTRARDRSGRVSGWSTERCSTRVFDDRALATSPGWTRGTGTGVYLGTVTSTTTRGAALVLQHVNGRRVALLVTTCPTCGSIQLTNAAGTVLRTVSLVSSTTRRSVLLPLGTFASTGSLTLRVVSGGRLVRIDGLGVGR